MVTFTLDQVLTATHGQLLVSGAGRFTSVSTDTRSLQPGALFIALRGERFDGHAYLEEARARGAAGALIQDAVPGICRRHTAVGDWSVIEVTDSLYALGQLAQAHRQRFRLPVIGITGSAGKTTTKEMTAAILETRRTVLKTAGNFNNEIGLPLTLCQLDETHQAAVVEFGMRGLGQIGYLTAIARPNVGVITNIGLTHLELLGSQEAIALAKAEILDQMQATSTAILPGDDGYFPLLREHARGPIVTVGEGDGNDVHPSDLSMNEEGCLHFTLHTPQGAFPLQLGAPGRHQVWNALAASAAALAVGATPEEIMQGLAAYQGSTGRMRVLRAPAGYTVVDDTYNANPAAMQATLHYLAETAGRHKLAILGDMRELGPAARDLHQEIGRYAADLGIDALFAVGELGQEYVAAANARGMHAAWFPSNAEAAATARALLEPGDIVLVKGSRAMKMEEIVSELVGE